MARSEHRSRWVVQIDDLWPGRPRLLHDEAFSSWFARTAAGNGLRPAELHHILQPGGDRNPRDLDRYADVHLLHRLADCTGREADALGQSTFRRWAGTVFEGDDGLTKFAWLPPAGRQGGRRCFGQQLCPWCLRADAEPYLRLTWRLSFVTTCPVHQRLLLDRCPRCSEPFHILRMDNVREMRCASCATDLRHVTADEPPIDAVPIQRDLVRLVSDGWRTLGPYGPVYSFAVLEILALVTRFLAGGPHSHALRAWVASQAPALSVPPEALPRAREGALLTPRARSVLISMAHWLMGEWPSRFVAGARAVGMTSTDLWKQPAESYPFAYTDVVEWHLKEPHKGGNRDEVAAAKAILVRQGRKATHRNLVELCGIKLGAMSELAEPADADSAAWGKGRYWKLDGVSPEVKAAARIAAHRTGEGVGPWLDALLRRELGIPARKTPCPRPSPDTFAADCISGCAE